MNSSPCNLYCQTEGIGLNRIRLVIDTQLFNPLSWAQSLARPGSWQGYVLIGYSLQAICERRREPQGMNSLPWRAFSYYFQVAIISTRKTLVLLIQ